MQKHQGACHCRKVRFEADTDLARVISCNCSICSKRGLLLTFVPESRFRLLSGAGDLKDSLFNKQVIHHQVCTTCGVEAFARGTPPGSSEITIAVNVRCLDGVDLSALKVTNFDGKSL